MSLVTSVSNPPDPVVYALIAAAVSATLGPGSRVHAVVPTTDRHIDLQMFHWSLEGRRQIFASHRLR
ncbi:MAG TPA: hypothetical protein VGD81_11295 [Opitutaceae bacterium]